MLIQCRVRGINNVQHKMNLYLIYTYEIICFIYYNLSKSGVRNDFKEHHLILVKDKNSTMPGFVSEIRRFRNDLLDKSRSFSPLTSATTPTTTQGSERGTLAVSSLLMQSKLKAHEPYRQQFGISELPGAYPCPSHPPPSEPPSELKSSQGDQIEQTVASHQLQDETTALGNEMSLDENGHNAIEDLQMRMHTFQMTIAKEDAELVYGRKKRNLFYFCATIVIIGVLCILFGIIFGVYKSNQSDTPGLNFREKQRKDRNDMNPILDLEPFLISECYSNDTLIESIKYRHIRSIVESAYPDIHGLDIPYSRTSIALCWLSLFDTFDSSKLDKNSSRLEFIQRFLVAMMFFHVDTKSVRSSQQISPTNTFKMTAASVCEWIFVDCSNDRISGLSMSNENLPSIIATEIGYFDILTNFEYSTFNDTSSQLPSELWNLTLLKRLFLSIPSLGGTFPNSLTNLRHLEELYIDGEYLIGTFPDISQLSELKSLTLNAPKLDVDLKQLKSLRKCMYE
jgi:hypothetical protein